MAKVHAYENRSIHKRNAPRTRDELGFNTGRQGKTGMSSILRHQSKISISIFSLLERGKKRYKMTRCTCVISQHFLGCIGAPQTPNLGILGRATAAEKEALKSVIGARGEFRDYIVDLVFPISMHDVHARPLLRPCGFCVHSFSS
jgi:hypothetical protein